MALIDDLIQFAHRNDLVQTTTLEADGCDAYLFRNASRPITVWVRPDGRFSRAAAGGELLTLGQVMNRLVVMTSGVALNASRFSWSSSS